MTNSLVEQMLKGMGTEIHVAMDDEKAIYCEGENLASTFAKILHDSFGVNTLVGKETKINSNANGPIKVFPIAINDVKSNCLVIRTRDTLSALGIREILSDSKVHHRGLKIMPISNGRRKGGRRSHSVRK